MENHPNNFSNLFANDIFISTQKFSQIIEPEYDSFWNLEEIDVSAHHQGQFISSSNQSFEHQQSHNHQVQETIFYEDSTQLEENNGAIFNPIHIPENTQENPQDDDNQDGDNQDNEAGVEQSKKKVREDNNYFKKFITFLNIILKKQQYLASYQAMKKQHKDKKVKSHKDKRYGFTIKLIHLKKNMGIKMLHQIQQSFTQEIYPYFEKNMGHCPVFMGLIPKYIESFELYCNGNTKGSLEVTYEGAKQMAYMARGVQFVLDYEKQIQNADAGAK